MQESIYNRSFKAGGKTYCFDIRETKSGDRYLHITESRMEAGKPRKTDITVFKEHFDNFLETLQDIKEKL